MFDISTIMTNEYPSCKEILYNGHTDNLELGGFSKYKNHTNCSTFSRIIDTIDTIKAVFNLK